MKSPETIDAIVGHGQGYEGGKPARENNIPRPSVAGRLEMASAGWLINHHGAQPRQAYFSGYVFPKQEVSLARVDAEALKRATNLTDNNIIVEETATTTLDEVTNAAAEAKRQGWQHVVHITVDPLHKYEVKTLVKRTPDYKGVTVDVVTAEDIFKRKLPKQDAYNPHAEQAKLNQQRYLNYIAKYKKSSSALMLLAYEVPKVILTALHGEKMLKLVSKVYRPDPTQSPLTAIKSWFKKPKE